MSWAQEAAEQGKQVGNCPSSVWQIKRNQGIPLVLKFGLGVNPVGEVCQHLKLKLHKFELGQLFLSEIIDLLPFKS